MYPPKKPTPAQTSELSNRSANSDKPQQKPKESVPAKISGNATNGAHGLNRLERMNTIPVHTPTITIKNSNPIMGRSMFVSSRSRAAYLRPAANG
jgi:hypothetical protein